MIYEFEHFTLATERRELRRESELVAIEPQVFDILEFLIANRARVVSSDDLINAVWRGRIVAEATVATRMNAVRRAIGDSGERQQLIRTIARKGYRFIGDVREQETHRNDTVAKARQPEAGHEKSTEPGRTQPLSLPDKPSIAVLPFANLSGDPEQEYFTDGITEDLTTALSQFRWLFVIARNSSFVFKGKAIDAKQIARDLGVRYLLEGSVRKAGNRVRITGQLVEASTGAHLWADRFDGALEDIFELQDKVTTSVVGAIGPKLEQAEIDRAKRKPTESLDAYDYYLRGMANLHQGTKDSTNGALRLFYRAIELDPDFASAYGMAAWCYELRRWNGWMADTVRELAETERLGRRAAELGKNDAVALCAGGFALARAIGDLDFGAACIDRALTLNPNFAAAWHFSGWVRTFLSEPDIAIEHVARAIRLSPFDPSLFLAKGAAAMANFVAARYEEASSWALGSLREQPNFVPALRIYAAACAMSGHNGEAQKAMARACELDPAFHVSDIKGVTPLRRPEDLARYEEALRKAGLPE